MTDVHKVISAKCNSSVSIQTPTNEVYFTVGNKYILFKDSFYLECGNSFEARW